MVNLFRRLLRRRKSVRIRVVLREMEAEQQQEALIRRIVREEIVRAARENVMGVANVLKAAAR